MAPACHASRSPSRFTNACTPARLHTFVHPLLCRLDTLLDARLVPTFGALLLVLLQYRYRMHGMRWPKRNKLHDEPALTGYAGREVAAWQPTRGKRSWERRPLWDARHHCWRQCGVLAVLAVLAVPVYHTAYRAAYRDAYRAAYRAAEGALLPLWLVVARQGKDTKGRGRGREP